MATVMKHLLNLKSLGLKLCLLVICVSIVHCGRGCSLGPENKKKTLSTLSLLYICKSLIGSLFVYMHVVIGNK